MSANGSSHGTRTVERTVYRRPTGPLSPSSRLQRSTEVVTFPSHPCDVLLQVHAVSLNYRDANILRGNNPWTFLDGGMPCTDAVGEVIAVGPGVTRIQVGDRVSPVVDLANLTGKEDGRAWTGSDVDGVLGTHVVFREKHLAKLPAHLCWIEASTILCAGLTAWSALNLPCFLSDKTVLLQGTGGVSLFALKLAYAANCRIILMSSSDAKLERLKKTYSRIETLNFAECTKWDEEVLRMTDNEGADIVLENGGASSIQRSLNCTKRRGTISLVGYLGGEGKPEDLQGLLPALIDRAVALKGVNIGSKLEFEDLLHLVDVQKLDLNDLVDKVFPFDRAQDAFDYLLSGGHVGKVVISVIRTDNQASSP